MKENKKSLYRCRNGYALLRANPMSVNTMREYWKGSPWRALRSLGRG